MIDLSTKAGVLRFCELRRAEMVRIFHTEGHFSANGHSWLGYAFMQHMPDMKWQIVPGAFPKLGTGRKLPAIEALPCRLPPEEKLPKALDWTQRTLFFGDALREFARAGKATGVVVMSEAWFHRAKSDEEYRKAREEYRYGWVEEQPDRGEMLMMRLEHIEHGVYQWHAEIHRNPDRVDPWKLAPRELDDPGEKSRLTHLVDWRS